MQRIGRYEVTRLLGRGGMGVVYAAHDERLDRPVAIKVIRPEVIADDTARRRFTAEARAAARVSHPNICPLYEFDEHEGQPFLVMELLDGESLAARLTAGKLPVATALSLAETMLDALAALHRRGVVHRDLKPANIFLTPHGLKLLDFGLAQPIAADEQTKEARLTGAGLVMGTPAYMAPEQLFQGRADERADVFAAAAVIYEMLAGRPPFTGATVPALMHAVGYEEPPPLEGDDLSPIDSTLRQALVKNPAERVARADVLAAMLREAAQSQTTRSHIVSPGRLTRFVALPLRVLRPDEETDFLAFSVPDAVSVALAAIHSIVVRSARGYVAHDADVRTIGRELSVDVVLTGTLLRAGQHVRVSAQLADAGAGTIIWSEIAQAPIEDLFQLQDTLTHRIVSSLALPLTARDRRSLDRQVPASAEAYELFLRANTLMNDDAAFEEARDLYQRAVAIDPAYAPAWARLGRAQRMLAKWGDSGSHLLAEAETAFRRAFEIDPDLPIAHDLAAYVDAELGRAPDAMERLLLRARRLGPDAGLMSGLVTTCRYAGLLGASRAAHDRAVAIDPSHTTSVAWTFVMMGEFASAIRADAGTPPYALMLSRLLVGEMRPEEVKELESSTQARGARVALAAYRTIFEGAIEEALRLLEMLRASGFNDPEGWYTYAYSLARAGAAAPAVAYLRRSIDGGYAPYLALTRQPEWQAFGDNAELASLSERAKTMMTRAQERFDDAGGRAVLGAPLPT